MWKYRDARSDPGSTFHSGCHTSTLAGPQQEGSGTSIEHFRVISGQPLRRAVIRYGIVQVFRQLQRGKAMLPALEDDVALATACLPDI
jgi:hypothetical protein